MGISMMCRVIIFSQLSIMTQCHAQDADAYNSMDTLFDKLLHRTQREFGTQEDANLDHTTFGKTLAKTYGGTQAPSLRTSSRVLKAGRGMKQWPGRVPPRLTQPSVTVRAAKSDNKFAQPPKAAPIALELPVDAPIVLEPAAPETEPINLLLDCAPAAKGGESDLSLEVKMTLDPDDAAAIRWKKARSTKGRPVVVVDSIAEDTEAYSLGMRPGMVVKAMIGGSGRTQNEVCDMTKLRGINMRNFKDSIRLARYPMTFMMLEGVELGDESMITNEDRRISAAYERRKYIEEYDERKIGEEGRDFPIVGLMVGATVLPPAVILALNAYFGWYTGNF